METGACRAVVALMLTAACGQSDKGAPVDAAADSVAPAPISVDDFAAAFAKAYCDGFVPCCVTGGFDFDHASCITQITKEGEQLLNAPPLRRYDPLRAWKCVDLARSYASNCRTTPATDTAFSNACKGIYAGTVAPDGACQSDFDCAEATGGPMRCEPDVANPVPPTPTCVLDPPGQLNEVCLQSAPYDPGVHHPHLVCADPLYCDAVNHCQPRHGIGEDCGPYVLCQQGLWCNSTSPTSGTCTSSVADGEACSFDGQCLSSVCYEGICSAGIPIDAAKCGAF